MLETGSRLDKIDRRYSLPNTFRGGKLSVENMNRTRSLKFQKVKDVKSARSHFQFNAEQLEYSDQQTKQGGVFFISRSRILKGRPSEQRRITKGSTEMMIHPPQTPTEEEQTPKQTSMHFYSANLHERMNFYMNNLLNKSSQYHKQKLKEIIQTKIQPVIPQLKQAANSQNLFWRKMRRYKSTKKDKSNLSPA